MRRGKSDTVEPVELMRSICDDFTVDVPPLAHRPAPPRADNGLSPHVNVWWPGYPEPVITLHVGRRVCCGIALEPEEARWFARALWQAADVADSARSALRSPGDEA